jgi:hypothetical protein
MCSRLRQYSQILQSLEDRAKVGLYRWAFQSPVEKAEVDLDGTCRSSRTEARAKKVLCTFR